MIRALVLVFSVSIIGAAIYFGQGMVLPACSNGEKILFEVPEGDNLSQASQRLKKQGIIKDILGFKILAKITGNTEIRLGEYELSCAQTPLAILQVLNKGVSVVRTITFPEGINVYEMAEQLEASGLGKKKKFLDLAFDKSLIKKLLGEEKYSLEGYLFPETYGMTKYDGEKKLINLMVQKFFSAYEELMEKYGTSSMPVKLNRHEQVILASIVEKETGEPSERPIIASVFYNRMKKNMRLQTDPTILYGILDKTKVLKNNITKKDIQTKTRYNTYRISGLPYGPIANPGAKALEAVLNPASTNYLYFVSRNDGTHVFSQTYKQHQEAVRKFQLDRSMREGKSWRDRYQKNSN